MFNLFSLSGLFEYYELPSTPPTLLEPALTASLRRMGEIFSEIDLKDPSPETALNILTPTMDFRSPKLCTKFTILFPA